MPKLWRLLLHIPNQHSLVLLLNKLILPYDSLQNSIFKSHFAEQKYISKNSIAFNRKAAFHIFNAVFLEVKLFSTEMKIIFQSKFALSPACHRTAAKEMPRKKVEIVKSNISDTGNLCGFGLSNPHYTAEVVTYQEPRIPSHVLNGTASLIKHKCLRFCSFLNYPC